jgi:hypothetical protein
MDATDLDTDITDIPPTNNIYSELEDVVTTDSYDIYFVTKTDQTQSPQVLSSSIAEDGYNIDTTVTTSHNILDKIEGGVTTISADIFVVATEVAETHRPRIVSSLVVRDGLREPNTVDNYDIDMSKNGIFTTQNSEFSYQTTDGMDSDKINRDDGIFSTNMNEVIYETTKDMVDIVKNNSMDKVTQNTDQHTRTNREIINPSTETFHVEKTTQRRRLRRTSFATQTDNTTVPHLS